MGHQGKSGRDVSMVVVLGRSYPFRSRLFHQEKSRFVNCFQHLEPSSRILKMMGQCRRSLTIRGESLARAAQRERRRQSRLLDARECLDRFCRLCGSCRSEGSMGRGEGMAAIGPSSVRWKPKEKQKSAEQSQFEAAITDTGVRG